MRHLARHCTVLVVWMHSGSIWYMACCLSRPQSSHISDQIGAGRTPSSTLLSFEPLQKNMCRPHVVLDPIRIEILQNMLQAARRPRPKDQIAAGTQQRRPAARHTAHWVQQRLHLHTRRAAATTGGRAHRAGWTTCVVEARQSDHDAAIRGTKRRSCETPSSSSQVHDATTGERAWRAR